MEYVSPSGIEVREPTFPGQVKELSGVNFNRCYQCLTCTLGCPLFFAMDYPPNQILRMIQLGIKEQVLRSDTVWLCASCETCATRCPNEVDIPRLMNTLRWMALQEKVTGKEKTIPLFHQIFLKGIRQKGRQHELGMLLELKFKVRDFFSDIGLGIKMLRKGKLALVPRRIKGAKEIKTIFNKSREGRD